MSLTGDKAESLRLLEGIENGTLSASDAYNIAKDRDPTILYFIFRYLREKYPSSLPSSKGVVERVIELTSTYPDLVKKAKQGEDDLLREWFDDAYTTKQFHEDPQGYIDMIIDKIEG